MKIKHVINDTSAFFAGFHSLCWFGFQVSLLKGANNFSCIEDFAQRSNIDFGEIGFLFLKI